MKLLFVIPEYLPHPGGGIATFYKNLLPDCASLGHEVRVILGSPYMQGTSKYELDGVRIEQLEPKLFDQYLHAFRRFEVFPELRRYLAAAWAAWEQAKQGDDYDLIETTDFGLTFIPWIVHPCAAPMQVQMHGSAGQIEDYDPRDGFQLLGGITRLIESSVLRHADRVVTYSTGNRAFWREQLGRAVDYEIPGFAINADGDPHAKLKRAGAPTGIVAGRVQYCKGPSVVCEAIRQMGSDAPNILWAGRDMPYQRPGQTMGEWLGREYPAVWGKKVKPIGLQAYDELQQQLRDADFGLVPSIWDMFNWTCVEHMSLGKPVVCSTGAGASDLIRDGETGLLAAAKDAGSLRVALERLLSNPSTWTTIGEAGRAMVEHEMNPRKIAHRRLLAAECVRNQLQERVPLDTWTAEFLSPDESGSELRAFLDQLPLRELASYTVARGVAKIRG